MKALIVLVFFVLTVSGCDQLTTSANSSQPKKKVSVKRPVPVHRFVQSTYNSDVAFDTQTGQICKTWAWTPIGQVAKPDPVTGNMPQRALGEFAPTCSSIYLNSPSQIYELEEEEK